MPTAALLDLIADRPGLDAVELRKLTAWDWEADEAPSLKALEVAGEIVYRDGWHIAENGETSDASEIFSSLGMDREVAQDAMAAMAEDDSI